MSFMVGCNNNREKLRLRPQSLITDFLLRFNIGVWTPQSQQSESDLENPSPSVVKIS